MSVEIAAVVAAAGATAAVVRGNAHRLQHVATGGGGGRPDVTTSVGRL